MHRAVGSVLIGITLILGGMVGSGGSAGAQRDRTATGERVCLAASGSRTTLPALFIDRSGQLRLAIQLGCGLPDTNQFDFYVADQRVLYEGVVPLRRVGPHTFRLGGTVLTHVLLDNGAPRPPARLRMEGSIDAQALRATLDVWVAADHYHLVTGHGSPQDAAHAVDEVIVALRTNNWRLLYMLMASEVREQYTEGQFVRLMATQHLTPPLGVTKRAPGRITTDAFGLPAYEQPLAVQERGAGRRRRTDAVTLYMEWDHGAWRFLSTDSPPS